LKSVRRSTEAADSLEISRLGFGGWSAGGPGWAFRGTRERDRESVDAMLHAFERGVTWIDTAPTYGSGHSEELVGRALELVRGERPLVFTKCGRRWDAPTARPRSDHRPDSIRADCEASLRRLGVDAIDLLQLHWPDTDTGTPVEESWGELLRLIAVGKIRGAGVCNFDVDLLERCESAGHVESVQMPFSLIARESASGLMQWCHEHGTAVIVYSPMQVGLLTDSFSRARLESFAREDWRRRHPEFQAPRLERNIALRDALRPIAEEKSTTVAAIAVAWTLSWPQVTGAIVGASKPEQVDGWIDGASIDLSDHDLEGIAAAIAESGAGSGPVRPQAREC
jgi:aryl-alcohol dehydrogenase-like predicted oxidoreductase